MRAVIDIGTNSILLLVGALTEGGYIRAYLQISAVTRLGEALERSGMITQEAVERSAAALEECRSVLESEGVEEVAVVATEVLRAAKNRSIFLERIRAQFGWKIKILSGEEEAKYSYLGALDAVTKTGEKCLVMDVGGGSTEIITGVAGDIKSFQSLSIGAVRLWEKMDKKEILTEADNEYLENYIGGIFESSGFITDYSPEDILIGLGGTITTLVAIRESMQNYDAGKVNGYCLKYKQLESLFHQINQLSMRDRKQLPGLVKGREDIIVYGIQIFRIFMYLTGFKQVTVSDRGLRFGYLKHLELTNRGKF